MKKKYQESHLTHAYHQMLHYLKAALPDLDEKAAKHSIERIFDKMKAEAVAVGQVTQEEAEEISDYLKRDVEDAARFIDDTEHNFFAWLRFDAQYVEQQLLDAFMSVADHTKTEQLYLQWRLKRGPEYHTGEVTGIGTLQCENCGEILHFHDIAHIPPCPKCQKSVFSRPPA